MVKCPVCPHEAESYDTLVCHLMQHKKADIVYAFLNCVQNVEAKLRKLESDIDLVEATAGALVSGIVAIVHGTDEGKKVLDAWVENMKKEAQKHE